MYIVDFLGGFPNFNPLWYKRSIVTVQTKRNTIIVTCNSTISQNRPKLSNPLANIIRNQFSNRYGKILEDILIPSSPQTIKNHHKSSLSVFILHEIEACDTI